MPDSPGLTSVNRFSSLSRELRFRFEPNRKHGVYKQRGADPTTYKRVVVKVIVGVYLIVKPRIEHRRPPIIINGKDAGIS